MTRAAVCRLLLAFVIVAVPLRVYAQEAVIIGTITDSTGGVLPGVTVTALNAATGNRFTAVTDERGAYRIPGRIGTYQITAELPGFTTVTRSGVELLVGQTATIDMRMAPSSLQETITVSGEAPLINTVSSSLGGNIDPRQVQELPVQGRNWMALAMLAPGSRMTSDAATTPLADRNNGEQREFQLTVDGQQVSSERGFGGQPRYSQESIAEFQYISNRFDATMGRSSGVQVKAVTRSGTNVFSASARGNFRDSRFNARNPVLHRVVPIDNQQLAFTVGGPILRDRLHYFGNYEYEREPKTSVWNTPYPRFNAELHGDATVKLGGVRVDYQLSPHQRVMGKVSGGRKWDPFGPGNNSHPAATGSQADVNHEYLGQLTQVIGTNAVNEVKFGYTKYFFDQINLTTWSRHWQASTSSLSHPGGVTTGSPRITFTGFAIGGNQFYPQDGVQTIWSARDDFAFSYIARGRHDAKLGAEFLRYRDYGHSCRRCMGVIDARGGPVPANIEQIFPDPWNADTWNFAAISSITRTYDVGVGNFFTDDTRPQYGFWFQDDWQVSSPLTLNLGVRYDLSLNASAQHYSLPPFVEAGRPEDKNNVAPRIGFAYRLNPRTVLRGGSGLYFAVPLSVETYWMAHNVQNSVIQITNDGRPDFAANPLNGQPLPTLAQARARFCHVNNMPGCLRETIQELSIPEFTKDLGRTWQTSVGVARQVGTTMSVEADYIYSQGRNEKDIIENINMTFDPATGANYPFSDISRRAYPEFGLISAGVRTGKSSYHALQTAWTKRLSHRWQGSATYTLSGLWDIEAPPLSGLHAVPFPTSPDLGDEFTLSANDLRHRAVFNGIWQAGGGLQISGLYYLGLGERAATVYGGDLRVTGAGVGAQALRRQRLRPDGSIVPRNSFTQPARNRVDVRVQQRIPLPGRASVDGIAEVFNAFNSPNWTITTDESSRQYLQRTSGLNRTAQFGFRLTF
jgi:hypothetical protein